MQPNTLEKFKNTLLLARLEEIFKHFKITAPQEYLEALASHLHEDFFTAKTNTERCVEIFLKKNETHAFRKVLNSDWGLSLKFLTYIATYAGTAYVAELKASSFWETMYKHEALRIFILSDDEKATLPKKLQQQVISILLKEFYIAKGRELDHQRSDNLETDTIELPTNYTVDDVESYYNVNKSSIYEKATAASTNTLGLDSYPHNTVQYYLHQQQQASTAPQLQAQTIVAQPSLIQWTRQNAMPIAASLVTLGSLAAAAYFTATKKF